MKHYRLLLLFCAAAFAAALWGSVDCGARLAAAPEGAEAAHLRRLIYFHFALSQLAVLAAVAPVLLRHRAWKRYYLLISYNERGMHLNPPGIRMPRGRVYRCHLHNLATAELPPADAPVLVYPLFMLSGSSSGERLVRELDAAYACARRRLYYQPVLGASPWLARAAAERISTQLRPGTGVLVVAHGSPLPEPPPEPALFCRRLRELLPGTEVVLGYFGCQQPAAAAQLAGMQAAHVLLLPFLLTEGVHTAKDLPSEAEARACGKTLERLPVAAELLPGLGREEEA